MAVIMNNAEGQYVIGQQPTMPEPYKTPGFIQLEAIAKSQPNYAKKIAKSKNLTERNGHYYNTDELNAYDQQVATQEAIQNAKQEAKEDQKALWEREDAIRKETQAREDSALQRWAEDARRAGINPNLALGATGSASGGGITNASEKDYTLQNTLTQGDIDRALADLERAFQADENAKDRLNRIFSSFGLGAIMRIGK